MVCSTFWHGEEFKHIWPKRLQKKVGLTLLGSGQHMRLADEKKLRDHKKSVYSTEEFESCNEAEFQSRNEAEFESCNDAEF